MFTPRWKKEALLLVKGSKKFLNYKRDILSEDRILEIESRRKDLLQAINHKDAAATETASSHLRDACDQSLPKEKPLTWLEEHVEVMFVAIVIALGLRAYYLQPFRIPTGSMQPTLNGITGTYLPKDQWPSFPKRVLQSVLRGRSYIYEKTSSDLKIATTDQNRFLMADSQFLHFFSRSQILLADSRPTYFSQLLGTNPLRLPAPLNPLSETGLSKAIDIARTNGGIIPKNTVLCEGYVDTGDLVLVDKFSYHFRKPKRGEVFVFDTLGIRGIHDRYGDQAAGSHYIKRLCGIPGDTLKISPPYLYVNDKIAKEPGINRVIESNGIYYHQPKGYSLASHEQASKIPVSQYLARPDQSLKLEINARQGFREYAALGDNTLNSLDSRYWGPVKEYNLVGPALFSLWPFTSGHWGLID